MFLTLAMTSQYIADKVSKSSSPDTRKIDVMDRMYKKSLIRPWIPYYVKWGLMNAL